MARTVAIVFTPDYASELEKLAFRTPVWLVDTPANRAAAEEVSHAAVEWPHLTVTLFRAPDGDTTKEDWSALLEQISFQERTPEALDVMGAPLTEVARAALTEAGLFRFEETPAGFRARRA